MPDPAANSAPVACIDCGSTRVKTAFVRAPKDANYVTPTEEPLPPDDSRYVILRCSDCGSVFLHPAYFEESFAVYETERYFNGYFPNNIHTGGGPSLHPPAHAERARQQQVRWARRLLRSAKVAPGPGVRVMDVGSGSGDLVQGFADLRCDAYGVDLSAQAAVEGQHRGLKVVQGRFRDLDSPDDYFDLVVSIETFEHVAEVGAIADRARRALKPGGALVIQVPNDIGGYRARWFRNIWWMIPPMHIRYFTAESLRTIFGRHGFRVDRIETTGSVGRDLAAVLRWRARKRGLDKSPVVKLAARALPLLFRPADALLNARKAHSEMIAVLRPVDAGEQA